MIAPEKTIFTSSVSSKGQITLPKDLRDKLHIEPKDIVVIALKDGRIEIEKAEERLLSGFGVVPVPDSWTDWKTTEREVFDDIAEQHCQKWLSQSEETD